MVQLQILSKILETHDNKIVEENFLTEDFFTGYTNEFNFIQEHVRQYGNVPDKATFLSNFPEIELVEVTETDKYLVDTIREEYLYQQSVPVLQKMAEILKTDSNAAAEYMASHMAQLQPNYGIKGTDIISQAKKRLERFKDRKANPKKWCFESGFPELDDITGGIQREEEYFVIYARTSMGKSWIAEKIATHIWGLGYTPGYFSPEMSDNSIGFRFDTLISHYSNKDLARGGKDVDESEYEKYIEDLAQRPNHFYVTTLKEFGGSLTVSKVKNWILQQKLDVVVIDGLTYMSDERGKKNDNKSTALTNISEDLMSLSVEMQVPIIAVVQANRTGVVATDSDDTPELDTIRDSDGISHNASTVLAIQQKKNNIVMLCLKKHRNGVRDVNLRYVWDINTGVFTFVPSTVEDEPKERTRKKVDDTKEKYKNKTDVF